MQKARFSIHQCFHSYLRGRVVWIPWHLNVHPFVFFLGLRYWSQILVCTTLGYVYKTMGDVRDFQGCFWLYLNLYGNLRSAALNKLFFSTCTWMILLHIWKRHLLKLWVNVGLFIPCVNARCKGKCRQIANRASCCRLCRCRHAILGKSLYVLCCSSRICKVGVSGF